MHRSIRPDRTAARGSAVFRRSAALSLAVATTIGLAGCATTAASQPSSAPTPEASVASPDPTTELGTLPEPLPTGAVVGEGVVLDAGTPMLCLGDAGASLPPVCAGIPLTGWEWSGIDGWEERSGTRWGSYAVTGTWDGETVSVVADPVMLALYDPIAMPEAPVEPGSTPADELERIAGVLQETLGERLLDATPADGRLDATVVYDDGTLQEHLDGVYGDGVVRIASALRDVGA